MSPFAPRKQRHFRGAKGDDSQDTDGKGACPFFLFPARLPYHFLVFIHG